MTQFRRTTERMGAAGIAQYQTARLRQAGMLPNPRNRTFHFYSDASHGWLKVPIKLIKELNLETKISPFSYKKGDFGYLEEDLDAPLLLAALKKKGVGYKIVPHWGSKRSRIRNYSSWGGRSRLSGHPRYHRGNPRLKAVPKHLKDTDRGPPYVFPKRKSYPINDLFHARLALIYVMSPTNAPKRDKVINAVADRYPQYNWAAWWNQELKDPKHCRRENIKACPFLKTWSHYRNGGGRGSWEQDDPATKHRNPRRKHKASTRRIPARWKRSFENAVIRSGLGSGAIHDWDSIEIHHAYAMYPTAGSEAAKGWIKGFKRKHKLNPGKAMKRRKNAEWEIDPKTDKYIVGLSVIKVGRRWGLRGWINGKDIHTQGAFKTKRQAESAKRYIDSALWEGRQGRKLHYPIQGRYGYYAVDAATPEDMARHTIHSTVQADLTENGAEWLSELLEKANKAGLSKKKSSSRRNPMPRKRPTRRKNAKTAMTKAEYRRFNAWRGWRKWELDEKYNDYKKRIKRETKGRKVTRTRKRRNPKMTKGKYMERLSNLQPYMSTARKNSLWKKYSR